LSNWVESIPTAQSYALNKVLFDLHHHSSHLERFKSNAKEYLSDSALTLLAKEAILNNDVAQLYLSGANPYLLRAHCIGIGIPEKDSVLALKSLLPKVSE
jgi:Aromatic-ring-opening dioxygenase LigAB, LigA subunit